MLIHELFPDLEGIDDPRDRRLLAPVRVVHTWGNVQDAEALLTLRPAQPIIANLPRCTMQNTAGQARAAVLLDFGRELHGTLTITTRGTKTPFHVRLGESVGEALTPIGERGTTNHHASRDYHFDTNKWSANETPESGFRFAYVELVPENGVAEITGITATLIFRDIPYRGSFRSSDSFLDRIYTTAAYTVHLNMQRYLWDGIKRDRLIWAGDMNPEVNTILTVFGSDCDVVPKSLDYVRDVTPATEFMNGITSYTLWWAMCHYDWFLASGDIGYLEEQHEYLVEATRHFLTLIDENGCEQFPPNRFLDWPNRENEAGTHAGLQGLGRYALLRIAAMLRYLREDELSRECVETANRMLAHFPDPNHAKQPAALLSLGGFGDPKKIWRDVIMKDGAKGLSTFLGYYTICAGAKAGEIRETLDLIREYWGGMLKMGATTFWEDFDVEWMANAIPLDRMPEEGKDDIHGDFGRHCYKNFRHSLCHGWASGPAPFLTKYVLGVRPFAPGYSVIRFQPELGDLEWAQGTVPTPKGDIRVELERAADGTIRRRIELPKGITILKEKNG